MCNRRAVRKLALASLLSGTGTNAASIALSFLIYERTGSAVWLSTTLLLTRGVTGFLTPVAGAMVDRFDRRPTMVISDLLGAVCWVGLLAAYQSSVGLVMVAFLASIVSLPFRIASRTVVPNMVPDDQLAWANGLIGAAENVARIAGSALGGLIFAAMGARAVFGLNAASFLVSALIVATLRARFSASNQRAAEKIEGILDGFRTILGDTVMRWLTTAWAFGYLAMNIAFVADVPLAKEFGTGSIGYGLIDTFFAAGGVVGAVWARAIGVGDERRWVLIGMGSIAIGYGLIAIAPWFALVLLASGFTASLDAMAGAAGYGLYQRRSPDHVRGRVFGAVSTVGSTADFVGLAFAGFVVEALGPRGVYALGAAIAAIAVGVLTLPRSGHEEFSQASPAQ